MVRYTHVVLLADGLYVLQHRDDKPGIAAPGVWALFGGRVEDDETPQQAAVREVGEELCVAVDRCEPFWTVERYSEWAGAIAQYSFFEANISRQWGSHRLMEGQAVDRFDYDALLKLPMFPVMRDVLARHHTASAARSNG